MSDIQISPYINFQGRAREAMEFYQKVLGGDLDLQTMDAQGGVRPAAPGDNIMYSRLEAGDVVIIGVDGRPEFPAQVGDNVAVALGGTDTDRLTQIFAELAEGGVTKMPLRHQPWGGSIGWLTDRFGINWVVSIYREN